MKEYDLIAIGTGSAMMVVDAYLKHNQEARVAVIDKDEPGGICLTRGCIPTKLLVYPAELVRLIGEAGELGIEADIKKVHFDKIMQRMRSFTGKDVDMIRRGLSSSKNIDYYPDTAEFTAPYPLKVGGESITSRFTILCTGSKPMMPPIKGIEGVQYHTSDTILQLKKLPRSIVIVGGGYIAAEYGHFFSAMGSKVTIVGRNPQFLKMEEPEVSAIARRDMSRHMTIITNHEVRQAEETRKGRRIAAVDRETGKAVEMLADELLIAAGRSSNSDILHPERAGIETDEQGWIKVDEHLRTSQPGVWALGDAIGRHLFKHAANHEALVLYYNAVLGKEMKTDYHAVPHAVFTYPEIASVGMGQARAIAAYGKENVLIGFHRYQDTAKGEAMNVRDCFVKAVVRREDQKILGAHIIGPQASVLIQEVINLMYAPGQNITPMYNAMHIHPALSEVVDRAFSTLMPVDHYMEMLRGGHSHHH